MQLVINGHRSIYITPKLLYSINFCVYPICTCTNLLRVLQLRESRPNLAPCLQNNMEFLSLSIKNVLSTAAGMALPQNNLMSGIMSSTTGNYQTSTKNTSGGSQCLGQLMCMASCKNSYTLGSVGSDGCRSCTCKSGPG